MKRSLDGYAVGLALNMMNCFLCCILDVKLFCCLDFLKNKITHSVNSSQQRLHMRIFETCPQTHTHTERRKDRQTHRQHNSISSQLFIELKIWLGLFSTLIMR